MEWGEIIWRDLLYSSSKRERNKEREADPPTKRIVFSSVGESVASRSRRMRSWRASSVSDYLCVVWVVKEVLVQDRLHSQHRLHTSLAPLGPHSDRRSARC